MPSTPGTRWDSIKAADRLGTGPQGQSVDQTQTAVTLAGYAADGNTLTRTTIPVTSPLVGSGGNAGGSFPTGAWHGQVPRGVIDGSNRVFQLDYTLGSPFTILMVNGWGQKPPRDGNNANPIPDYAIQGTTLTYRYALKTTDWHYIWYFIGDPAPTATDPGPVASATLHLVSAHYPNASSPQWGGGAGLNDTISLFTPHPGWIEDTSVWDKRTDTKALGSDELTSINNGSLYLLIEQFHVGGSSGGWAPPNDEFWIYDCFIVCTFADSSTRTWRPTHFSTSGSVTNPENALDGDDSTYAVLAAPGYGIVLDGAFLRLDQFQPIGASDGGGDVDQINGGGNPIGGGTGPTGDTASADQIYSDMVGSSEAAPHGVTTSTDPVNESLPSGDSAIEWWSTLFVDAAGNPATNTRIAVKNVQMWWFNTQTNEWVNGFGPTNVFDGGYYREDYLGP